MVHNFFYSILCTEQNNLFTNRFYIQHVNCLLICRDVFCYCSSLMCTARTNCNDGTKSLQWEERKWHFGHDPSWLHMTQRCLWSWGRKRLRISNYISYLHYCASVYGLKLCNCASAELCVTYTTLLQHCLTNGLAQSFEYVDYLFSSTSLMEPPMLL